MSVKLPALDPASIPEKQSSSYPSPFRERVAAARSAASGMRAG